MINYWLLAEDNKAIPLTLERQNLGFSLWLAYAVFWEKMRISWEDYCYRLESIYSLERLP